MAKKNRFSEKAISEAARKYVNDYYDDLWTLNEKRELRASFIEGVKWAMEQVAEQATDDA